jgi:tetratricopeptide (TPR) repeat protein
MKKNLMILALGLAVVMPAKAQWNSWNTSSAISGVFGAISHSIESAERKKQMEIHAKEKLEYEQSFKYALEEAKSYEASGRWEDALDKYEEVAKLNCNYGYTDQQQISRKITALYEKAGRTEEGPSILNNAKTILPDYSKYRYVRENPVYVNKKDATGTKIVRVACSNTETRLEIEGEANMVNGGWNIKGQAYINGNKGGKLKLVGAENIAMAPATTVIPWPFQKLRFALIFEPLPEEAIEFEFIEPSSSWQFKKIKCK